VTLSQPQSGSLSALQSMNLSQPPWMALSVLQSASE